MIEAVLVVGNAGLMLQLLGLALHYLTYDFDDEVKSFLNHLHETQGQGHNPSGCPGYLLLAPQVAHNWCGSHTPK